MPPASVEMVLKPFVQLALAEVLPPSTERVLDHDIDVPVVVALGRSLVASHIEEVGEQS
jgi:hypothetical protein